MRVLVADDDSVAVNLLGSLLDDWGYEVVTAYDGGEAWDILQAEGAPRLAILDWMMPVMDGTEICRKVRRSPNSEAVYLILVTVRGSKEDIISGLEAGADDYIPKPFDNEELRARIQVGRRIATLQSELGARVDELQEAMAKIKVLSGLLPICSVCKKIRDDKGYWNQIESYIRQHSEAEFTHSYCPDCMKKFYPNFCKVNNPK